MLTDFCFRALPENTSDDDEYGDEAWFGVGPRDVFPAEFKRSLGLPQPLREVLDKAHGELYDVGFWQEMQERVKSGEIIDIFPYDPGRRLHDVSDDLFAPAVDGATDAIFLLADE